MKKEIRELIDKTVLYLQDGYTDDQSVELLEDPEERIQAIEYIIEKLEEKLK